VIYDRIIRILRRYLHQNNLYRAAVEYTFALFKNDYVVYEPRNPKIVVSAKRASAGLTPFFQIRPQL
jgi:hypothetical protein